MPSDSSTLNAREMSLVTDRPEPVLAPLPVPLAGAAGLPDFPDGRIAHALQPLFERLAFEVLHHQKVVVRVGPDVVQDADIGVIEAGDRLRLAVEALFHFRILREMRRHDLDGDDPVEAGVLGLINLTHAPGPNRAENLVRTQTCAGLKRHELSWRLNPDALYASQGYLGGLPAMTTAGPVGVWGRVKLATGN